MEWQQVLVIVGSNIAMMMVTIGTSITMWMNTDRKIEAMQRDTTAQLTAIREEMKDFHGRLCAIEERNRGK